MSNATHGLRAFPLSRVLVVAAMVLVVLVVGGWTWWTKKRESQARPGAYAIPIGAESRTGAWFARTLTAPRTLKAGQVLTLPEESRVRIVYADGRSEDVSGPLKLPIAEVELRGEIVEDFLAARLEDLAKMSPDGSGSSGGDVRVTSPVSVTRFTNPVVSWAARPGINYDVAIVDPTDPMAPPRIAEKIRPPVAFEELKSPQTRRLQADRMYEVYVREAGNPNVLGAARVLLSKDAAEGTLPTAPPDLLREAVEAMAKRPTRTGDAWLALSRLPADWSESELAVRLRLRIAAELGLADELARAQGAARRLMDK